MNDVGRRLDWGVWNTFMKSTSIAFQCISQHLLTGRGMVSRDLLMPLSFSHPACKTQGTSMRDWVTQCNLLGLVLGLWGKLGEQGLACSESFSLFKYMNWWVSHLVHHTWLKRSTRQKAASVGWARAKTISCSHPFWIASDIQWRTRPLTTPAQMERGLSGHTHPKTL